MRKLLLVLALLVNSAAVFAIEDPTVLPVAPADCFEEEIFCHNFEVLQRWDDRNPHGYRVTRVSFFAKLDAYEFESHHDIIARFKDTPSWIKYTEYTDVINMYKSIRGNSTVDSKGRTVIRHESHYDIKGPRIIGGKVAVREVGLYTEIDPVPGALASVKMDYDPNYPSQGVKHKTGEIHLAYDADEETYDVFVVLDIVPEINILPKVGAPYMEAGLVAIFKGMFNLY